MFDGSFPGFELLLVAGFAFVFDASKEVVGGFELVPIFFPPLCCEFAFEGVFEKSLAIDL